MIAFASRIVAVCWAALCVACGGSELGQDGVEAVVDGGASANRGAVDGSSQRPFEASQLDGPAGDAAGAEADVTAERDAVVDVGPPLTELVCGDAHVPSDPYNCGRCGHDCTLLAHLNGAVSCDATGQCNFSPSTCAVGWAHCSATPDDGCETDVSQASSCGDCGVVCPPPAVHGQAACTGGACTVQCDSGYAACGGACVDVQTDGANCGACGAACPGGMVCGYGQCGQCPNAEAVCDGQCVNEQVDKNHCGGCLGTCGAVCSAGQCVKPVSLAISYDGAWAIMADGTVRNWSDRADNGSEFALPAADEPFDLRGAMQISDAGGHTCALDPAGTVRCWGDDGSGALGDGMTDGYQGTPVSVVGLTDVTVIAAGDSVQALGSSALSGHTCAIVSGGTVSCWGLNASGQLGDGTMNDSAVPGVVPGVVGAVAIAAGASHTCALVSGGAVECWGLNDHGELGSGTTTTSARAVRVTGLAGAIAIAVGQTDTDDPLEDNTPPGPEGEYTCALISGGTVRCWGVNQFGELGNGTTVDATTPVTVTGISGAIAIAAGSRHACALLSDGTVWCWGANDVGQLGNGTTTSSPTPVAVSGLSGATAIAAGGDYTCVIAADGSVQCWGLNGVNNGNALPQSFTPSPVLF